MPSFKEVPAASSVDGENLSSGLAEGFVRSPQDLGYKRDLPYILKRAKGLRSGQPETYGELPASVDL